MKTLLYAPTQYRSDITIKLCSDTWYFEWQKKLYDVFNGRKDVNVIWKSIGIKGFVDDPIRHLRSDNIRYSTKSFKIESKKTDL